MLPEVLRIKSLNCNRNWMRRYVEHVFLLSYLLSYLLLLKSAAFAFYVCYIFVTYSVKVNTEFSFLDVY